jgi:CRISPR-associated protein Cmr1
MESVDLRLETVTPLFLHGADNETLDGLRPPPFKALFRYWWRAVQGPSDLDGLREAEAELFGATSRRSPLLIRIPGGVSLSQVDDYQPLPHRPGGFVRQAYSPGQSFLMKLSAPELAFYTRIAKIGFLLGGVGNRSRRGFGSIRDQSWNFATLDDLRSEVLQTLDGLASGRFSETGGIIKSNRRNFPNYPVIQKIYFGRLTNNVDGLLRRIGQATHDYANPALGSASPRMASPIHVRVQKIGDAVVPIVTQLSSNLNQTIQQNFINAII